MSRLDRDIASAIGLLGVLLVFVLGYFAALFPVVLDLLSRSKPDVAADRKALATRLGAYVWLLAGLAALAAGAAVVLAPLSRHAIASFSLRAGFPTLRAGLLLLDLMLLTLIVAAAILAYRLRKRIGAITA
jgi:hypothetical protein